MWHSRETNGCDLPAAVKLVHVDNRTVLRNLERFLGALFCRTRSRRRHCDHPTRRRRRPARSRRGQRSASPVSSVLSSGPQHLHIQVRCDGTTARRARLMHRPTTTPGAPYIDRTTRSPTQLSLDAHAQLSRKVGARPANCTLQRFIHLQIRQRPFDAAHQVITATALMMSGWLELRTVQVQK